ncbi:serine-threonine/tyrosine-protein kinase catalytic domain-containing protein [Artemisia annua]|uniref:Serine-threonine/tyrosine-protein kinase catalytic domain-containing protein n=1 Tax=Artemisia annua TaxID=35608 RepID=A0A2U1MN98_ARTAN|nr:serine-threonine/tyrosine-protein kinase catalytic domain-containing protein [Artemisia annua]
MASSMKGFEHLEIKLEEIKLATNNFNEENVIGHGGFGKVYKGELSHSRGKSLVALKRLDRKHGQGDAEFYKEVRMLSCYKHENIISLLGFSSGRDEMILVYEYASRGSLDGHLKNVTLKWKQRIKICLDAAKGLSYLHNPKETYQRLIHCDIKSANILLDKNFNAKVADFGLSKIGPANQQNSILVTDILGTHGYCDPVFMETYTLTKESDVYSFGVVLFEVLCGMLCVTYSNRHIKVHVPSWKKAYEDNKLQDIILKDLMQQMDPTSLKSFAGIAYHCLNKLREERPLMSLVVEKLESALNLFQGGRCYIYDMEFKACVRGQYLTPQISYTLNLVFRYKYESDVNSYNPLRYKIDLEDETKVFIIYPSTHMREDGWFIAPLYQFTSQHKIADMQFEFEYRAVTLLVAGMEFQPSKEKVELPLFQEYQDIVEFASQSVLYTSVDELKQILSKGVLLNGGKTWFSLNEKGQHCHMISMEDCLIPNEDFPSRYKSHYKSRFPVGLYQTYKKGFKTHVKTQLLSPSVTYTVNLVFEKSFNGKQAYANLKYRLRGEETTSTVYLANQRRQDDWLCMAELYQFSSDGSIVDLEIMFDDCEIYIRGVEGFLFQPLEIVEDTQTISDSGILNLSSDTEKWTMKKNLYSSLGKLFQFNNGTAQEWSYLDKNEKKCLMLSARATCLRMEGQSTWRSLPESRFREVHVITGNNYFGIVSKIPLKMLSPETAYASYLVYKLPQDRSTFEAPLKVNVVPRSSDPWYIYLASPPNTPVIEPKFDENSYNPLNRHKLNALPRRRSDGWMEVKVWQFDTWVTPKRVSMHLKLEHPFKKDLSGLIIHGTELRPL